MPKHIHSKFDQLLAKVEKKGLSRWSGSVERGFLAAVESFDAEFAKGTKSAGWYKAKARYFNDLLIALLQNWSKKTVVGPVHRDSQLFHKIDIDICFPKSGAPRVAAEVKALGTPGHPGNSNTPRAGRSDLHKRVREVAFTATDLKAAYARPMKIRSFEDWVQRTDPKYFSFWAVRVQNQADYESVRSILVGLGSYCNGVGAVIYQPSNAATALPYQIKKVPELSMDKAIRAMAQYMAD